MSARRHMLEITFMLSSMKTTSPGFVTHANLMKHSSIRSFRATALARSTKASKSTNGRPPRLVKRKKMPSVRDKRLPKRSDSRKSAKKISLRKSACVRKRMKSREKPKKKPAN